MGLQNTGLTMGTIIGVAGMFTLTSMMKAEYAFPLLAAVQILWLAIILGTGMIKEPDQMSDKEKKKMGRKSMCGKVYSVLKQTFNACRKDPALAIGLIAISISRNGAMLQ